MPGVRPTIGLQPEQPHSGTVPNCAPISRRLRSVTSSIFVRLSRPVHRDDNAKRCTAWLWPEGLDRSVLTSRIRLAIRTRNALGLAGLLEGDGALTVHNVMRLENFGRKSLSDLLVGLETFLNECVRSGVGNSAEHDNMQLEEEPTSAWCRVGELLTPIIAAGAELYGTASLASALHPDLLRLATRLGVASDLSAVPLRDLVDGAGGPASVASTRLTTVLESLSDVEKAIVEHRILRTPAKTLEEIGSDVGVTRERIRQLQEKLEGKLRVALEREMDVLGGVLKEQCGHLISERSLENRIQNLLPSSASMAKRLFRHALIGAMGYVLRDGVYYDDKVAEVVEQLVAIAQRIADDVGLVEEEQLIAALPSPDWHNFWPWLRDRCRLHDLFGRCGLRASTKARTKAALLCIGRPATRVEIGQLCGLSEARVGATLSNVSSVVRADKERWGLKDWIDDEYDGIVGEILQRIEEDGGATTTERLLTELPSKFGVSPNSVRTFMHAPKFEIRDGWISVANTSSLQLRLLDDVIEGRDGEGDPYWTFVVDGRFLDGYSLTGVPPEFAKALGCEPDEGRSVRVANLVGFRDLSLSWRLSSTTGASLGYLARPLQRLGLHPGQRARVTIKGPGQVELTRASQNLDSLAPGDADVKLAQILNRRRAL